MEEILTRCGYRCDLCLAYAPNVKTHPENQQMLSDGWYKYFGFRISPEKILCDGCMAANPNLVDQACPVRPCVIEKGITNCTECEEFDCEKLKARLVVFEEIQKKFQSPIAQEDRKKFIAPYENKVRLDNLRCK